MVKIFNILKKWRQFRLNSSFISLSAFCLILGVFFQKIIYKMTETLPLQSRSVKSPILDYVDYIKSTNQMDTLSPEVLGFVQNVDKMRGIIKVFSTDISHPYGIIYERFNQFPQTFFFLMSGLVWMWILMVILDRLSSINSKLFLNKDQNDILSFVKESIKEGSFEILEMNLENDKGTDSTIKAVFKHKSLILGINFLDSQRELILYDKDSERFIGSNHLLDNYLGISICETIFEYQNVKKSETFEDQESQIITEDECNLVNIINNKKVFDLKS